MSNLDGSKSPTISSPRYWFCFFVRSYVELLCSYSRDQSYYSSLSQVGNEDNNDVGYVPFFYCFFFLKNTKNLTFKKQKSNTSLDDEDSVEMAVAAEQNAWNPTPYILLIALCMNKIYIYISPDKAKNLIF